MTQRRRQLDSKRSSSINTENVNGAGNVVAAAAAAARRRSHHHRHNPSSSKSRFDYIYRNLMKKKFPIAIPSYVSIILLCLTVAFFSYRALQMIIDYRSHYEYTNTPIDLPKLVGVNDTSPQMNAQRFWGTYR